MISANAVLFTNDPISLESYGIDRVKLEEATHYLSRSNPSVIGAHCTPANFNQMIQLLLAEKHKNPNKRFLIFYGDLSTQQITECQNLLHPSQYLPYQSDFPFHEPFEKCFAEYYEREQSTQLVALVNEKNEELKRLTISLENKIQVRQKQLETSTQKNTLARQQLRILKETLERVYSAHSYREIEAGLVQTLSRDFDVMLVQIRLPGQSNMGFSNPKLKAYKTGLKIGELDFGHIIFYKDKGQNFDQKQKRILSQVAEAVSLAVNRINKYRDIREAKIEWEATFDAISDPICLTDEEGNTLRLNRSYSQHIENQAFEKHLREKSLQNLLDRIAAGDGSEHDSVFQLPNAKDTKQASVFEVYSSVFYQQQKKIFFHRFRDVTQNLNLERQVIETAKMAELGTISSSIAHELNNPIGGMLNFVQLMKMDLTGDEEFYGDIIEIEKGIEKCRNIVKNLLGFVRKSFNAEIDTINLVEVIEQAIKITELKTRSIGIEINFDYDQSKSFEVTGRFNLLTHAIRNILQNSQESLIEKRKQDKAFKGIIEVHLNEDKDSINVEIKDNGQGLSEEVVSKIFDPLFTTKDPETNSGLGLTLALQIVKEHKGVIEVSTSNDNSPTFNLRFFKPEVQSGPSGF